jgi:7-carboxy-7-deazaguanine synthase
MSKQIIKAYPNDVKLVENASWGQVMEVSEFFFDTIQGEGIHTGHPAAFLRLQHCTLNCVWCDTTEVWRAGNPYTVTELLDMMEFSGLVMKLNEGQHLIFTGGSPLRQQLAITNLVDEFYRRYKFKPYIEVENECVLKPLSEMLEIVDCWNNSPKLSNSGNSLVSRHKPEIIKLMSLQKNSWFKFVIDDVTDWQEIQMDYLEADLIHKDQIILMPEGSDRGKIAINREFVVKMAIEKNVRYCSREHIILWNKVTGV